MSKNITLQVDEFRELTPLQKAFVNNDLAEGKDLLTHGENPDQSLQASDQNVYDLFALSIIMERADWIKLLLNCHLDLDKEFHHGGSYLTLTCQMKNIDLLCTLLDNGSYCNAGDTFMQSPFAYCIAHKTEDPIYENLIDFLLNAGVNPYQLHYSSNEIRKMALQYAPQINLRCEPLNGATSTKQLTIISQLQSENLAEDDFLRCKEVMSSEDDLTNSSLAAKAIVDPFAPISWPSDEKYKIITSAKQTKQNLMEREIQDTSKKDLLLQATASSKNIPSQGETDIKVSQQINVPKKTNDVLHDDDKNTAHKNKQTDINKSNNIGCSLTVLFSSVCFIGVWSFVGFWSAIITSVVLLIILTIVLDNLAPQKTSQNKQLMKHPVICALVLGAIAFYIAKINLGMWQAIVCALGIMIVWGITYDDIFNSPQDQKTDVGDEVGGKENIIDTDAQKTTIEIKRTTAKNSCGDEENLDIKLKTDMGKSILEKEISGNYDVIIDSVPPKRRIHVLGLIRDLTQMGLRQAIDFVDTLPSVFVKNIPADQAEDLKLHLEEAGAVVHLEESRDSNREASN